MMGVQRVKSVMYRYKKLILIIYILFLLSITLFNRSVGDKYRMELTPFWSYREVVLKGKISLIGQMICNIVFFTPWSILFGQVFLCMKKLYWSFGSAMIFSVVIEISQLVFKLGLFEFDDVFHNTLGALIGYAVWRWSVIWRNESSNESR